MRWSSSVAHTFAHCRLDQRRLAGVLEREHAFGEPQARRTGASTRSASASRATASRRAAERLEERLDVAARPSQPRHAGAFAEQRRAELAPTVVARTEQRVGTDAGGHRSGWSRASSRSAVGTRSTVTPGVAHVDEEHRQAARSPRSRIGARDRAAPVALVRAGDEHLLAVEHEPVPASSTAVVVMLREVGAGARLGVRDARDARARRRRREEPARAARRDPKASTVGATSTAAVSIIGASWYAASKLTTACQLRGFPPPPYSVGRLTPRSPAAPARAEQRSFERARPNR